MTMSSEAVSSSIDKSSFGILLDGYALNIYSGVYVIYWEYICHILGVYMSYIGCVLRCTPVYLVRSTSVGRN